MNSVEVITEDHLNLLNLQPERLMNPENFPAGWQFLLAPGITAELFLSSSVRNNQLQIVTTMECQTHTELDQLTATVAPFVTPCVLANIQSQVSVRLSIVTSEKNIPQLLSSGIIIIRRLTAIAFTAVVDLTERKENIITVIEKTLSLLQPEQIKA